MRDSKSWAEDLLARTVAAGRKGGKRTQGCAETQPVVGNSEEGPSAPTKTRKRESSAVSGAGKRTSKSARSLVRTARDEAQSSQIELEQCRTDVAQVAGCMPRRQSRPAAGDSPRGSAPGRRISSEARQFRLRGRSSWVRMGAASAMSRSDPPGREH